MHGVSWEYSLALIAMLASIRIEPSSASTEDLETDLDNSQDAEFPEENQQESLTKPERRLMAPPPRQGRGGWSFNWPWPFGRRRKRGGSP
ncbi:MAG TPA: hypothetical protein V6D50_00585 [Chroococcales cyanobacterium]